VAQEVKSTSPAPIALNSNPIAAKKENFLNLTKSTYKTLQLISYLNGQKLEAFPLKS
jgi:hypothetical protein